MFNNRQRFIPLVVAIAVFTTVFLFLVKVLPGIQTVEIDIEGDHPDLLRLFHANSLRFREEAAAPPVSMSRQRTPIKISLNSSFSNFLRIDIGEQKGTVKIYQLKVASYFSGPLLLGPKEIGSLFTTSPDAALQVFADHVAVGISGNDPYLMSKTRLFKPLYGQAAAVALLIAVVVALLAFAGQGRSGQDLPAAQPPSPDLDPPDRLEVLDGLRGLAALMVIADHTWGWFRGVGASGVWIFFALSGFLLARPFINAPRLVLSLAYLAHYLRRRFLRILPMYYTYIFVVYLISGRFNLGFVHALFVEGDGHLWAIPQEMLFYLLWPLAVFLIVLPLWRFPKLTLLALFLVMAAWNRLVTIDAIWLLGMDHVRLPLFFGVFLAGVFFSFLYFPSRGAAGADAPGFKFSGTFASALGLAIVLFFLLFSTGHIFGTRVVYSQKYFGYYGFLAGFLIYCVVHAEGKILHKTLTLAPLRELGIVGLSLYLVHPLVKRVVDGFFILYFDYKLQTLPLFLATLAGSYLLARYTYNHIERPGFQEKLGP